MVSEISGNWSAFPSGQTTNNAIKGSRGYSLAATAMSKMIIGCAYVRVTTFIMGIKIIIEDDSLGFIPQTKRMAFSYNTDKVEVMMEYVVLYQNYLSI